MKKLEDIQKMRYDRGCVVYNTNNYTYGIVLICAIAKGRRWGYLE